MSILGASKKVEVGCKLESVAGIVEYVGVQRNFLVGFEVRGLGGSKDVDTSFLLLSVRGFLGGRGLVEESLADFRCKVSHSLV